MITGSYTRERLRNPCKPMACYPASLRTRMLQALLQKRGCDRSLEICSGIASEYLRVRLYVRLTRLGDYEACVNVTSSCGTPPNCQRYSNPRSLPSSRTFPRAQSLR